MKDRRIRSHGHRAARAHWQGWVPPQTVADPCRQASIRRTALGECVTCRLAVSAISVLLAASSAIRTLKEGKSMIRRVKNTAAVILAMAGMAFAVVALAAASAAPAGAASLSSASAASPDFTCPAKAVCTFYGENLDNTPHTWWPGNRSGQWWNFNNLGVNNPGSLRNNSAYCVWLGTQAGGSTGHYRFVDGNFNAAVPNLQHTYGWFFITAIAQCGEQPPS